MIPTYPEFGRKGYEAYAKSTGGKTFDGRDMPAWDALPDKIQDAWNEAAQTIVAHLALGVAEIITSEIAVAVREIRAELEK